MSHPPARVPEPAPEWVRDDEAATWFGTPEAIRAGLLPEQAAAFDAALTAARRTLRLDRLRDTLRAWRRMALMTRDDPESARRLVSATAEVRSSGAPRPGSVSWADLRSELGF
ncbi:DUF6247 family protein [Saccharothrix longispora]|uniref:DUF222 domain-containing protein n=1 Tax=Saccharothrix longispora TaxID=33920 RepID=A0ABU1Q5B3_9PSEU|nr:DUF6247 family protein [Saccharothrix longispora]MDR6598069.1 hypothetical protein [Saccharothrix longispora]